MATRKYPPQDDLGLLAAGNQFIDNVGDPTEIGLTAADMTRLSTAVTEGQTAFDAHSAAQVAARTATTAKDEKMGAIEDILQEFNGRTQKHPGMDDALRTKVGLPIYDAVKSSAPAPTEMPVITIDTITPLRHEIVFSGESGKGKPEGVKALEIYLRIGGDATGNVGDYQFQAQDTASPYTRQFDVTDSGKQAHYLVAWVNNGGERGPWKMASATITSELQSAQGDL